MRHELIISQDRSAVARSLGPIPDPIPGLIEELITYPFCEVDEDVRVVFSKGGKARCAYCKSAPVEEVDHIIPISLGGPDRLENYAGTCPACNMRKKDYLLPLGILGIMLMEAAANAPTRRSLIEKRRAARHRANPNLRKGKVPDTKRFPHHLRLSAPDEDLLDLIGLDATFRGSIPLSMFEDRHAPTVGRLLAGRLAEGPYADRLVVEERDGYLVYSPEVASLWVASLGLRGEFPQVILGPDWRVDEISARTSRNMSRRFYQASVTFPLDVAHLLLSRAAKKQKDEEVYGGVIEYEGDEARLLSDLIRSDKGLQGFLVTGDGGRSELFKPRLVSSYNVRLQFSERAVPTLEAMISARSASLIMQEAGKMRWEFKIDRTVPVRPGLLFEADQDWSAETRVR